MYLLIYANTVAIGRATATIIVSTCCQVWACGLFSAAMVPRRNTVIKDDQFQVLRDVIIVLSFSLLV